jgi:hypothetical protein
MINARAIPQYRQENIGQEFKISWTMAAALIAIVILGGLAKACRARLLDNFRTTLPRSSS